jgi:release factor glutamine methyltransferase
VRAGAVEGEGTAPTRGPRGTFSRHPQGGVGAASDAGRGGTFGEETFSRHPPGSVGSTADLSRRGTPVGEALDGAITAIAAAGCETPRLDAEVLLAHALGVSRARLTIDRDMTVAGPAVRAFQEAVRRRAGEREPVAYIVGRRGFRRLEVDCDRRALIPRPETELLVEVGLGLPAGARVLDVGTGGGAVALALKDERPDLEVSGSDSSEAALELAKANGEHLGLEVRWLRADLLEGAPECDAILANLPYMAEAERSALAPEIVRHEPPVGLFAGEDGLDAIRALLAQVADRPRVGLIALEVGAGQAAAVSELTRAAGFRAVHAECDLAGIERVVVGERRVGSLLR